MTTLYPLKFRPILKERIWGGTKLRDVFSKPIPNEITGESWEVSAVKGDISVVENGVLQGKNLQELIEDAPQALLGKRIYDRFGKEFPILIKFIDAREDLSIQVHPNNALAQKRHNSFGKTEMWYVMDADPEAKLIVGFNKSVTQSQYQQHLNDGTLTDIMNYEPVSEGSTFFINTGKVHAIGAGTLLAEIQQTSDITYRVYDFNRRDANGNLRELHTEQALDAIDYEKKDDFKVEYNRRENHRNKMVNCDYFITNYLKLTQPFEVNISEKDSFHIYMCVKGKANIIYNGEKFPIERGETILVPALCKTISIDTTSAELLEVYL